VLNDDVSRDSVALVIAAVERDMVALQAIVNAYLTGDPDSDVKNLKRLIANLTGTAALAMEMALTGRHKEPDEQARRQEVAASLRQFLQKAA
jgi:hypothetical protein